MLPYPSHHFGPLTSTFSNFALTRSESQHHFPSKTHFPLDCLSNEATTPPFGVPFECNEHTATDSDPMRGSETSGKDRFLGKLDLFQEPRPEKGSKTCGHHVPSCFCLVIKGNIEKTCTVSGVAPKGTRHRQRNRPFLGSPPF